jgi:MoaA/NifB/PqqE/SkfB family radical SAM enzyme
LGRIVIELTNRCNLHCLHCFEGRHGGRGQLPLAVLDQILNHARTFGFDDLAFTGGEPTVHSQFAEIIRRIAEAGYQFGMVSNGWNFRKIYSTLLPFKTYLRGLTFSMDGATERTHDHLRGKGSYMRLLQAMSICVSKELPFAINMVLTKKNRHEVGAMVELAAALGSRGVRFGHLIPTPRSVNHGLNLSQRERRELEKQIVTLQGASPIMVAMAPGYHTPELFPCGPLQRSEFNIDWRGNVSHCCHLSGQTPVAEGSEVMGNLEQTPFPELLQRLIEANAQFRRDKLNRQRSNELTEADYFPCDYCLKHYRKVDRSENFKIGIARNPV